MGRIPQALRETIARNIKICRMEKFPGDGGAKRCSEAFGARPQQWSQWERGMQTPDECRLAQIAEFFGVTVEWLRTNKNTPLGEISQDFLRQIMGVHPISQWEIPPPGSPASFYNLARDFFRNEATRGIRVEVRLDKESIEYLAECIKRGSSAAGG